MASTPARDSIQTSALHLPTFTIHIRIYLSIYPGLKPEQVQEVLMGNVCAAGIGQAPARQARKGCLYMYLRIMYTHIHICVLLFFKRPCPPDPLLPTPSDIHHHAPTHLNRPPSSRASPWAPSPPRSTKSAPRA